MRSFKIKDMKFILDDIKRLYVAVIIKTGYRDETTEISLEWFESEGIGRVELVGFGIFVITKDKQKYQFLFKTREELDREMSLISSQIG